MKESKRVSRKDKLKKLTIIGKKKSFHGKLEKRFMQLTKVDQYNI